MGCDIHPIVEVRRDGKWTHVPLPRWGKDGEPLAAEGRALCCRNYDVFAILADVRNGSGFAGVVTGDEFEPIAQPRGLPSDVSVIEREGDDNDDGLWFGDHSHSWVTLAELEAVPWERVRGATGCVYAAGDSTPFAKDETYDQYRARVPNRDAPPKSYCGGVSGGKIRTVSESEWLKHGASDGYAYYVQVRWTERYRESVGQFYTVLLPWLRTLGAANDVRLVFGFDS